MTSFIQDDSLPPIKDPAYIEFTQRCKKARRFYYRYKIQTEMICALLGLTKGMKVIEIGTGIGMMACELASRGADCTALDLFYGNVQFLEYCANFYHYQVKIIQGDTCFLPIRDNTFDAVFSIHVFEHCWNTDRALQEQIRILKPGGKLLIIDGNLLNPFELVNQILVKYIKLKGKAGGLKWLFTKQKVYQQYGLGWRGKDEDIKHIWWWRQKLKSCPDLSIKKITTTMTCKLGVNIITTALEAFTGSIVVLAEKKRTKK